MFGMSSKEFWEEDPQLYWAYQTFYLKQQQMDFEKSNQYMWLQGMYIYEALCVALNNAFHKEKKSYSDKPYEFNDKIEKPKSKEEIDNIVLQKNNSWSRIL